MAKDTTRTTAELQRLVESWGQKAYKKTGITTCCLGGFQEKFSSLILKQTPAYSVIRHDWNFKWDWLLWSDETEKKSFLAANPPDEFSTNRDNRQPMLTVKYTAGSIMLWACFSTGGRKCVTEHKMKLLPWPSQST